MGLASVLVAALSGPAAVTAPSAAHAALDVVAVRAYLRTAPDAGNEVAAPNVGQQVYLHSDWEINGSGGPVTVYLRAVFDGSIVCGAVFDGYGGESGVVYCDAPWIATAGSHTLRWDYDYTHTVAETNEFNNSASVGWTSAKPSVTPTRTRTHTATRTAMASLTATPGPPATITATPARTSTPAPRTPTRTAAVQATRTLSPTMTAAPPVPSATATPVETGQIQGVFARGDANCSLRVSAADVIGELRGLAGEETCGNVDCDRDGTASAADVACTVGCLFGDCPVPPGAPRAATVKTRSAPSIVPYSVVRVEGTGFEPRQGLTHVSIRGVEAEVVEVGTEEILVVVPDIAPGPADVVVFRGDVAGPPLPANISPSAPIGVPDSMDGTLALLDAAIGRFLTLDLDAVYGGRAGVVRGAIDRLRADLLARRAALAGDPRLTAEVRARLDAAIDGSGIPEELRQLLADIESLGGSSVADGGAAVDPATVVVAAARMGQATRVVGAAAGVAGASVSAPVLLGIAGILAVAGAVVVPALSPAAPLIASLTFFNEHMVNEQFPTVAGRVYVEGTGFDTSSFDGTALFISLPESNQTWHDGPNAVGAGLLQFILPANDIGFCGRARIWLLDKTTGLTSEVIETRIRPVFRGPISPPSGKPFARMELPVRGAGRCETRAEFSYQEAFMLGSARSDPRGASRLEANVPNLLPYEYNVRVVTAGLDTETSPPFKIESAYSDIRIRCAHGKLLAPPQQPASTTCEAEPVPNQPLPSNAGLQWISSDESVATVRPVGVAAETLLATVAGVAPGQTIVGALAVAVEGAFAVSLDGATITVADEMPPEVAISTITANLVPGGSVRLHASATDNVEMLEIRRIAVSGDAVVYPSEGKPCEPKKSCGHDFDVDIKIAGAFSNPRFSVQAVASDGSGNEGTSNVLNFTVVMPPTATPEPATPTPEGVRTRTPTPRTTPTATLHGNLRAYVADYGSDTVTVIRVATSESIATIPVEDQPWDIAVSPDARLAYVVHSAGDKLSVIDTLANAVARTIPMDEFPDHFGGRDVAVAPDGATVYVAGARGRPRKDGTQDEICAVVGAFPGRMDATVRMPGVALGAYARGEGLAVTPDGRFVYVAVITHDSVAVISTASNSVVTTIPVGDQPVAVAIAPDGATAYVWNQYSYGVSVIDTASNTVRDTLPIGNYPEWEAGGLAVTPDGLSVWVVRRRDGTSRVFIIDTETLGVSSFRGPGSANRIAFTPDGSLAYITVQMDPYHVGIADVARRRMLGQQPRTGHSPTGVAIAKIPDAAP